MKKIAIIILSIVLFAHAQASAFQWEFDPIHTGFYFDVQHIYSTVRGQFEDFSGDVFFDPKNLSKSKINLEVKVKSINTNNGKRDVHLRSGDFFDADKYPLMTFKSSKITHNGGENFTALGKLTIKDSTKDTKLKFSYFGQKEHALLKGKFVSGLDSRIKINRLDYGVGDGKFLKMGVVGKDVNILISIEMLRDK